MKNRFHGLLLWSSIVWVLTFSSVSHAQAVPDDNGAPHAPAATQSSDALIATGEWDGNSSGLSGGGAVDWLHSAKSGTDVTIGMAAYRIAGSQWALARAGTFFRFSERWTIEPKIVLGGGTTASAGFLYQQYITRLGFRAMPRLYVNAQEEFIDIGSTHGHLLSGGVLLLPSRSFSMDTEYAHSAGGNLGTRFVSERFDLSRRTLRPFAGFAVGKTAPEVFDMGFGPHLISQDLHEGFLGLVFPSAIAEFTVAIDWIQVGSTQRSTVTAAVKFPIRSSSSARPTP